MTHTFAILDVRPAVYADIRQGLVMTGYADEVLHVEDGQELIDMHGIALRSDPSILPSALPMILHCPECRARHIDVGEFETKPHHTHACQSCGMVWRPAIVPTVGVQFLPGFKDGQR